MNVIELLQEDTTFEIGKALNKRLRDQAAELELTWGEMPGFQKRGAWYGGKISPKGGRRGESNQMLPFESRYKAFFKLLAKELSKLHSEGHVIAVAPNYIRNGTVEPLEPEQILPELMKSDFHEVTRLASECVACRWYVSFNEAQSSTGRFLRINAKIWPDKAVQLYMDGAFSVDDEAQQKEYLAKLRGIDKNHEIASHFVADFAEIWKLSGGRPHEDHVNKYNSKIIPWEDYIEVARNPAPAKYKKDEYGINIDSGYFTFKANGKMSTITIKLSSDKMLATIDKWAAKA